MLVDRTPQQVRFATQRDEQVSRPGVFHPEPSRRSSIRALVHEPGMGLALVGTYKKSRPRLFKLPVIIRS
jgi:hypothetical protein